jgi:hypothetical protein
MKMATMFMLLMVHPLLLKVGPTINLMMKIIIAVWYVF